MLSSMLFGVQRGKVLDFWIGARSDRFHDFKAFIVRLLGYYRREICANQGAWAKTAIIALCHGGGPLTKPSILGIIGGNKL